MRNIDKRSRKPADTLLERASQRLKCCIHKLFVLAFKDDTRAELRAAYQRFRERGTLASKVRALAYKAVHGLVSLRDLKTA